MEEAVERPYCGGAALQDDEVIGGSWLDIRPLKPDLEKVDSGSLNIGLYPSKSDFWNQTFEMSSTVADLSKDLGCFTQTLFSKSMLWPGES